MDPILGVEKLFKRPELPCYIVFIVLKILFLLTALVVSVVNQISNHILGLILICDSPFFDIVCESR